MRPFCIPLDRNQAELRESPGTYCHSKTLDWPARARTDTGAYRPDFSRIAITSMSTPKVIAYAAISQAIARAPATGMRIQSDAKGHGQCRTALNFTRPKSTARQDALRPWPRSASNERGWDGLARGELDRRAGVCAITMGGCAGRPSSRTTSGCGSKQSPQTCSARSVNLHRAPFVV